MLQELIEKQSEVKSIKSQVTRACLHNMIPYTLEQVDQIVQKRISYIEGNLTFKYLVKYIF